MYKAYWENLNEEEQDSLSSSFWTDQESEGEQRECFVKDDWRDVRTEGNPGFSEKQENAEKRDTLEKITQDTEKRLRDEDQSEREEEHVTVEEIGNDSTGINSGKESEEQEERDSVESEDKIITDKSGSLKSDKGLSESKDELESEEEEKEEEGLGVEVESTENPLKRNSCEKENREKVTDEEKLVNGEQISKSWAEDEQTGDEDLLDEEDEGSVKMFGRDCSSDDDDDDDDCDDDDEEVERFDGLDKEVDKDSEEYGLQNEKEVDYSTSEGNSGVTCERMGRKEPTSEDERTPCSVNQDDLNRFEQKEDWVGESAEGSEVGGDFLNTYNDYSIIEQTGLDEQKYRELSQMCETAEPNQKSATPLTTLDNDANETEQSDGFYTTRGETDGHGVSQQKWKDSVKQHEEKQINEDNYDMYEEKEAVEDYLGSTGSPTVSILTSGYGTYRPDSPRDELDYRDDCTLTGLEEDDCEYRSVVDCEDDYCQSVNEHSGLLETSEHPIPSLSLQRIDHSVDHCDSSKEETVQNTGDGRGEPTENRLGSHGLCNERDLELDFAAESVEQMSGIPSQVLEVGDRDAAEGSDRSEASTVYQDYHHPFNLRLSKSRTVFEHRNEHRHEGEESRKPKKVKSHSLKYESVSMLEERLDQLRVSAGGGSGETESEETYSDSDRQSSATVELPSAFEAYMKGMKRSRSENDIRQQPKAFIRPAMDHPHTRNLKKNDPVAKYFQYKQDWEMFKPPGEKNRKELHWAIREQLMYQPPPPKPQRTYVPNTYVVPTEKKRSALRWAVRHDLANGLIPAKITYP
ncbi:protein starmaker isoform X1 [Astyanax mexicanus]|uniref:protein starmaker isoform X1 n=1 Tax=Astyanax mexicanus TaxID=7994 RepID=UPI0020CAA5EF|nr:protein starmaker isoform X1 [Astyanax mexicanus]